METKLEVEIDRFLQYKVKRKRAKNTMDFYKTGLTQFAKFTANEWPPTAGSIEDFLDDCRDRKLSDGTIDAYFRSIKIFCTWLKRHGILPKNPIDDVEPPDKPERNQPKAPPRETLDNFFKKINSQVSDILSKKTHLIYWQYIRNLAIFSLLFKTGLRVTECSRLNLSELDMQVQMVRVLKRNSKTKKPREIPFDQTAASDLRLWLKIRSQLCVPDELNSVFVSCAYGFWETYTPSGIRQALKDYCNEWDIEPFTPHQLRHAFAVNYMSSGGSLNGTQRLLGHSNPQTTAIYIQMPNEDAIKEYRRVFGENDKF